MAYVRSDDERRMTAESDAAPPACHDEIRSRKRSRPVKMVVEQRPFDRPLRRHQCHPETAVRDLAVLRRSAPPMASPPQGFTSSPAAGEMKPATTVGSTSRGAPGAHAAARHSRPGIRSCSVAAGGVSVVVGGGGVAWLSPAFSCSPPLKRSRYYLRRRPRWLPPGGRHRLPDYTPAARRPGRRG